jgi:hypothetical protein
MDGKKISIRAGFCLLSLATFANLLLPAQSKPAFASALLLGLPAANNQAPMQTLEQLPKPKQEEPVGDSASVVSGNDRDPIKSKAPKSSGHQRNWRNEKRVLILGGPEVFAM